MVAFKEPLKSLEDIGVDIAVQGGAIFGWPLHFLEYPNSMYLAVIEALKAETFPNPKVGAVLLNKIIK